MSKMNSIRGRISPQRFYVILLVIFLMSFWLIFHISSFNTLDEQTEEEEIEQNVNPNDAIQLSIVPQQASSIQDIQSRIEEYNILQKVLNDDIFGPLQNTSLVIVIQVHDRLMYLRHTIFSLAKVKGIENALLIFSHDYYDEKVNYAIQSIDFCKVMQIFYPYSIQTHPNEFPGYSKDDCPSNITIKEALERKCSNALYPDQYGHYREAKFTQTKHHWWWKTNRVFDGLNITKNYAGLVVFLEEDHYVAQDFMHMLHLMERISKSTCPDCNVLSLAKHQELVDFVADSRQAEVMKWSTGIHNMGMAFNRTVWKEIKSCAETFCTYDDYNWDWTLLAVSNKCLSKEVTTMVLCAPRVFHIGECGMHFTNYCNNTQMLKRAQKLLITSSAYLFPQDLNVTHIDVGFDGYLKNPVANGGWGDVRDHNLCIKMVEQFKSSR